MSRFFVDQTDIYDSEIIISQKSDVKHIKKVLRMKPGDLLEISDGDAWEYEGEILNIDDDQVEVKIVDKQKFAREPELDITLYQGVPKSGKMELIVQKNVELGVKTFVPTFMDRTVVSGMDKYKKKIERYNSIAMEAAKQCRRGIIPTVTDPIKFKELLTQLDNYDLVIFPYENESNFTIKNYLEGLTEKPKKVAIVIGPEGGFSDSEVASLNEKGIESVTLGNTILRTETAGIATVAMVMYQLEI